jgi:hypothetical protein
VEFHAWQIISLVSIGLVAGVLGGMLGVGGSIIMIPGMQIVLGPRQHLYQASAMIVNVSVAIPAALRHYRNRMTIPKVLRWLIPSSVLSVLVGVHASNMAVFEGAGSVYLAKIFAVFLVYVIGYNIWRVVQFRRRMPAMDGLASDRIPAWRISVVGGLMGFMAGLLGIGGGALAVPLQQVLLRLPLKNAIANSACTMVFSAILGAIMKNATLGQAAALIGNSLLIAAALIPSAFIGGYLGAQLTHRLPNTPVRVAFLLLMVAAAWKMWTVQPQQRPPTRSTAASQPAEPGGAPSSTQPAETTPP